MREPTADEQAGIDWWNALTETERHQKLQYLIDLKKESTVAAAWVIEKKDRAHSASPAR